MVSVFYNTDQKCIFSFKVQPESKNVFMKTRIMLFLIAGILTVPAQSQSLSDLEWLSGYWTTTSQNGVTMEELWMKPSGGLMAGLHRDVFPNGRFSFEYLRIMETKDGILYVPSPGGKESVSFTLTEVTPNKAVFENLKHDFPQRIIYSLADKKLTARIEDESGKKGMQWTWEKTQFE